jgi:ankyrin repeat protein
MGVVCVVIVVAHWFLSFPVTNLAQGGRIPLHDAVLRQDIPSVMLLLEGGADINAQTAVSRANCFALHEWCELTVTIVDDCVQLGQTPLMIAAVAEDIPLMHLLLAAGAKLDLPDEVTSAAVLDMFAGR